MHAFSNDLVHGCIRLSMAGVQSVITWFKKEWCSGIGEVKEE